MATDTAISEGFRRAFREPAIVLAEIAWRWTFGLAALALTAASLFVYLDALPMSNVEFLALRRHAPWLIADAIARILYGGPRLLQVAAIVLPAIFVLWVVAASLGRAATLKALLRCQEPIPLAPQFLLHLLRASVALASVIGYLGALILAGRAAVSIPDLRPGIFLVVLVALVTAISILRSRLNWFLSIGAIFSARDGHGTFPAIREAVAFFRRHLGKFAGTGAVFGVLHGALLAFTCVAWMLAVSLAKVPPRITIISVAVITLGYFAVFDFLYLARLAAYVALCEGNRMPPAPSAAAPEPPYSPELPSFPGAGSPRAPL
jgi:hypothetical protein